MRLTRRTRLAGVALLAVASLTLAACGSGGGDGDSGATTDAIINVDGSEPQNPLIPTATNETGGGNVIDLLFAGLIAYEADGASKNEVAKSIESDDNLTWTVKINDDWKFSDGTPVKAESFVKAWNYGADPANAQLGAYFFYPIEGADENGNVEGGGTELSGLSVVDDTTFTIKLKQAEADFPARLGYSAFYPLPDAAFDDFEAFGENPIGNGPYKMSGPDSWVHDKEISLVPNDDYDGLRKARNGGIKFVFYTNLDAAYTDIQAGNLDILKSVPDSALATFESDSSVQSFSQPGSVFQSFVIPGSLAHFGEDEEGKLRRASISRAINREEVTDKIFNGTRSPAVDFSSPLMPGFADDIPGNEVLTFDADAAKDLWAQADAISPWEGKFELAYNGDGGHDAWVDAVTNQIKNNLGIEAEGKSYPTFAELRTDVTERTIKTAFRSGWQPDYPSIYNYLAPIYATGAGANDGDYSSAEFDGLITDAAGAESEEKRYDLYKQAQAVLMADLPVIPLWYSNISAVAALGVDNVSFNWQNLPEYYKATK